MCTLSTSRAEVRVTQCHLYVQQESLVSRLFAQCSCEQKSSEPGVCTCCLSRCLFCVADTAVTDMQRNRMNEELCVQKMSLQGLWF